MTNDMKTAQEFSERRPTGEVQARREIAQSPLSRAPAVPRGTFGYIQDVADGLLWVDFGGLRGVVACEVGDLL